MPERPILDDLELPLVQQLDAAEHQARAQHAIPALEGDFLQPLGRTATRFTLEGVIANEDGTVAEHLKKLREKFRAAAPVNFVADIATATRVDKVLIEEMSVRELAGKTQRFEYAFALREFIPAPAPEIEPPPPPPPPLKTGLIVEVIVEGQPGFDFSKVTVTVEGQKDDGTTLNITLTNRANNIWTEEDFPAGNYTAKAEVTDPPMSNAVTAKVLEGQKTKVTIVLRPGTANHFAKMFVVHFRFDNAFVEPCLCEVLKQVAQYAQDHPDEKLVIIGNTDQIGSPANIYGADPYNQSLSERRARAVYAYLTFGRDSATSVAEWTALRRNRAAPPSIGDQWGTRQYQYMLQNLGFYPGNVDGDHGPATDAAVQDYRQAKGLPPDMVVDDVVWEALITDYLSQGNLSIPESQFLPNKAVPSDPPCEDGILKWIGVASQDPVLNQHKAWRPNRRTEMLFIRTDHFPCHEPQPDTFNLPAPGAVNGNWCLGPGNPHQRTCFVVPHTPPGIQPQNDQWSRVPAEAGTVSVRGTIMFEDNSPAANVKYILIAPDGEFLDGERTTGEGVPGETKSDGTFEYPNKPKSTGIYTIEVQAPFIARLKGTPRAKAKGNVVCARLDGSSDFEVILSPVEAGDPRLKLRGTIYDRFGAPRKGTQVNIFFGDGTNADTISNAEGEFVVEMNKAQETGKIRYTLTDEEPPEALLFQDFFIDVKGITTEEGVRRRLHNIGYLIGDDLYGALLSFQAAHGLDTTGEMDAESRAKLVAVHDGAEPIVPEFNISEELIGSDQLNGAGPPL